MNMPALLDGRRMEMNNVKALVITTDWQKEDVISEISAENHSLLKIIGCDGIDKTAWAKIRNMYSLQVLKVKPVKLSTGIS